VKVVLIVFSAIPFLTRSSCTHPRQRSVEKEIEPAVSKSSDTRFDDDRPLEYANPQSVGLSHTLERSGFFIVMFLLAMLVVFALTMRK